MYHDGKWFTLQSNTTLIHGAKLILNFKFSNYDFIALEVSYVLGNLYYYKLNTLDISLLNNCADSIYTIINVQEINFDEIKKLNKPAKS